MEMANYFDCVVYERPLWRKNTGSQTPRVQERADLYGRNFCVSSLSRSQRSARRPTFSWAQSVRIGTLGARRARISNSFARMLLSKVLVANVLATSEKNARDGVNSSTIGAGSPRRTPRM